MAAFCEAKHVQHDDWLDKKLETAKPLEIVGGLRHDPIFNRLVGHIHKAYKQFMAVKPARKYPNVLVFMNSDKQCDNRDLVAVMTGNIYVKGGGAEPIYTAYSESRIKEEKFAIDLYVWFEESKGQDQKGFHYFIADGPHYAALCALLGSDSSKHVSPSAIKAATLERRRSTVPPWQWAVGLVFISALQFNNCVGDHGNLN